LPLTEVVGLTIQAPVAKRSNCAGSAGSLACRLEDREGRRRIVGLVTCNAAVSGGLDPAKSVSEFLRPALFLTRICA
jgi:hypothetical protein